MRHYRFIATGLAVLAFFSFIMIGSTALAAYPAESGFARGTSAETLLHPGSFEVAITVDQMVPQVKPPEKITPEKTPEITKEKSSPKPEKSTKKKSGKVSKSKKKVKKAEVKKPAAPEKKEEQSFISKTLSKLMGDDKGKAEKSADSKPEKEEPGLLTRALKKLVGGDEDKAKKKTQNNPLNPVNVAPTVSATQKTAADQKPKTAKSETKATLKDSFKKLIGVDAAKDKAKASVVKTAEQEDSGMMSAFKKILGGGDKKEKPASGKPAGKAPLADTKQAKKTSPAPAKQAQAEGTEAPGAKPVSGNTRKYLGQQGEEEQLEEDRGGVKKGKNILKESFKILVQDDKKKADDEE